MEVAFTGCGIERIQIACLLPPRNPDLGDEAKTALDLSKVILPRFQD